MHRVLKILFVIYEITYAASLRLHTGTQVRIEGPHERYIQRGSILAVTCTVDHKGRAGPQQVAWYQGAARLHYDSPRGGIALQVGGAPVCVPMQRLGTHGVACVALEIL